MSARSTERHNYQIFRLPRWLLPSAPLSQRHRLPHKPGVYYVMEGLKVQYVGLSNNLNRRWNDRARPHHKLGDFWGKPFVRIHYQTLPVSLIYNFEAEEIDRYNPPYNSRKESVQPNTAWTLYKARVYVQDTIGLALVMLPFGIWILL